MRLVRSRYSLESPAPESRNASSSIAIEASTMFSVSRTAL